MHATLCPHTDWIHASTPAHQARLEIVRPHLVGHRGCVNSLAWNARGSRLVSGSDDCKLNIWDPFAARPLLASVPSGHTANIFSARFMSPASDSKLVSCALDGIVAYHEVDPRVCGLFKCHSDLTYEVLPDPLSPQVFFSCSDDGTVNQYDLRIASSCLCDSCNKHTLIDVNRSISKHPDSRVSVTAKTARINSSSSNSAHRRRVSRFFSNPLGCGVAAISIHPVATNYMALGCTDDLVRIYDRRNIKPPRSINWATAHDASAGEVYSFLPSEFVVTPPSDSEIPETKSSSLPSDSSLGTSSPGRAHRYNRRFDPHKITSCKFDPSGLNLDVLVSYSGERVYLIRPYGGASQLLDPSLVDSSDPAWNRRSPSNHNNDIVQRYEGHFNKQTMIKEAYFYGPRSECIVSGSDDGTVVVWSKETGKMLNKIKADKSVVNCICPNPANPAVLAVSGIDDDIKILMPTAQVAWRKTLQENGSDWVTDDDGSGSDGAANYNDDNDGPSVGVSRELLLLYLSSLGFNVTDLATVETDSESSDDDEDDD
ncbi:hypothetical protein HDU84_008149 [Entophlyctis sp. JEL0112]|nr:hypothetical protein HDU84_008149 [Entophlyctis sp. JEL0112]